MQAFFQDFSLFPYESLAISAKENLGIDALKRAIWEKFYTDYFSCELFIPYEQLNAYLKIKEYCIEQKIKFNDDGQIIKAIIPKQYVNIFTPYIANNL